MKLIHSWRRFSTLNRQCTLNKNKIASIFHNQNVTWNYQEVDYHCRAMSKGLSELGFTANDNFLIRLPSHQQTEAYAVKVGTAGINANLIVSKASNRQELQSQLIENNVKSFFFQPTLPLGQSSCIEGLHQLAPELRNWKLGSILRLKRFPTLQALVQTNFYSYPGVYKYRDIMNYSSDQFYSIDHLNQFKPQQIPNLADTLVVTCPAHPFVFRTAILNSLINGKTFVCVEPKDANKICNQFNNKVDVIATNEIPILPKQIRIIVERGSKLMVNHKNRLEI